MYLVNIILQFVKAHISHVLPLFYMHVHTLYLPTHVCIMHVTRLQIKNVDHTHTGQFHTHDSQFWTTCSVTNEVTNLNSISTQNSPVNGTKCRVWVRNKKLILISAVGAKIWRFTLVHLATFKIQQNIFGNLRQCFKVVETSLMFRSHQINFQNSGKCIRKLHAFDLGKVGRYNVHVFMYTVKTRI